MIGAANSATTATASSATAAKPAALGQADFLRLMTAQMSAQDPFAPMDNSQFLAQLAQFSQVAGISEMNASLSQIAASLGGNRLGDASSWIGQEVLFATDIAAPDSQGVFSGEIAIGEKLDANATLNFSDADGVIVHSQQIGSLAAGRSQWVWDGKRGDGSVYSGPVRLSVAGVRADQFQLSSWAHVRGVRSPAGGQSAQIITDIGVAASDNVIQLGR